MGITETEPLWELTGLDASETENRVVIGVEKEEAFEKARTIIRNQGLPLEAFIIRKEPFARKLCGR